MPWDQMSVNGQQDEHQNIRGINSKHASNIHIKKWEIKGVKRKTVSHKKM
jgi:hypothetical protein